MNQLLNLEFPKVLKFMTQINLFLSRLWLKSESYPSVDLSLDSLIGFLRAVAAVFKDD